MKVRRDSAVGNPSVCIVKIMVFVSGERLVETICSVDAVFIEKHYDFGDLANRADPLDPLRVPLVLLRICVCPCKALATSTVRVACFLRSQTGHWLTNTYFVNFLIKLYKESSIQFVLGRPASSVANRGGGPSL